jgi:hypothetical protein
VAGHLIEQPDGTLLVTGPGLEYLGLEDLIVVIDDRIYGITYLSLVEGERIIDAILERRAPGAEVYANVACFRMGAPLRLN